MARTRRTPVENTQRVTPEKLLRLVNSGITSHSAAAKELGVTVGQISSFAWSTALVSGGVYSEAPDTAASVKKLYDVEGNRWELIAARTGLSVAAAQDLYDEAGGEGKRGTNPNTSGRKNGDAEVEAETPKRRGRPPKQQQAATTGKRATAAATPRRARTRAERRAGRSNNPS
jgi:hypothetical protein